MSKSSHLYLVPQSMKQSQRQQSMVPKTRLPVTNHCWNR